MQLPLIGPTYNLDSRPASVQRTINMMPVPVEPGNERTQWVFKDAPGLTEFQATYPPPPLPFILLSNFEAPDSGTSVRDESPTNNTPFVESDTHIELLTRVTANQPKYGAQSWEVNYQQTASLTNRILVYPQHAAYELPGQFTLAYWVRPDGIFGSEYPDVLCCAPSVDGNTPVISFGTIILNGEIRAWANNQAYTSATSGLPSVPVIAGTYNHIEVTRDASNVLRAFVRGQKVVEQAGVTATLTARDIVISGYRKTTILPNVYSGGAAPKFYDSIALLKGLCLHTANFTPPTVPYSLSMTLEQAQGIA